MRNMDYIGISVSQSVVSSAWVALRKRLDWFVYLSLIKLVSALLRSVQAVVDTVFEQGEPAISVVRR
jgi:hypothetical protein